MKTNSINSISPLDGRYFSQTAFLAEFFSEKALIQYRLKIEIEYFIKLTESNIDELKSWKKSNNKVLNKAMKSEQRIYEMEINNESQYVMIKEIQYHPVTDEVLHVDFMRVLRSEKMTISVPLILTGKAVGVTEGGILSQSMNQIEISCYPTNVPENIEVNIDNLELNASLSVADVNIDDDEIEIISPDELNVATIAAPREEEEPVLSDEDEADSDVESSEEKTDAGEEDTSEQNEDKKEG